MKNIFSGNVQKVVLDKRAVNIIEDFVNEFEKLNGEHVEIFVDELQYILKINEYEEPVFIFMDYEKREEYCVYEIEDMYRNYFEFKTYIDNLFL